MTLKYAVSNLTPYNITSSYYLLFFQNVLTIIVKLIKILIYIKNSF